MRSKREPTPIQTPIGDRPHRRHGLRDDPEPAGGAPDLDGLAGGPLTPAAVSRRRRRRGGRSPPSPSPSSDSRSAPFVAPAAVVVLHADDAQADPATHLVHLDDRHVDRVAPVDDVLDLVHPAAAEVGDVQQAVDALGELDERAEGGRLDDLRADVGVAHLDVLGHRADLLDGRVGLLALDAVDLDRAVVLDRDLDLVVGLEAADRLAALADDGADAVRVDLDRRDARRPRRELRAGGGDGLGHDPEDVLAPGLRLGERVAQDLEGDAGDLDVHLQGGDAVRGAGDLEVHVAEVVLVALDVARGRCSRRPP